MATPCRHSPAYRACPSQTLPVRKINKDCFVMWGRSHIRLAWIVTGVKRAPQRQCQSATRTCPTQKLKTAHHPAAFFGLRCGATPAVCKDSRTQPRDAHTNARRASAAISFRATCLQGLLQPRSPLVYKKGGHLKQDRGDWKSVA